MSGTATDSAESTAPADAPAKGTGRAERLQWARLGAFVLSVAVLMAVARGGTPRQVVVAAFVLFTVAATVWVRGQYAESLDGEQWVPRWPWLLGFAALGGVLLLCWWKAPLSPERRGDVLVAGAVVLYLVFAFALACARTHLDWPVPICAAALFAGVAAAWLLLRFLGDADAWVLKALGAVAVLGLAVGLALLSERGISWMAGRDQLVPWLWMLSGALVLGLAAAESVDAASTRLVLLAVAALALLVVAGVSSTQADVVVVLALVALMGVTPQQARRQPPPEGGSAVLVALGDSYMSGEGASRFYEGTDEGGGNNCRRAPTAWAVMAGRQPPFDGVDFLACSGARTYNLRADKAPDAPVTRAQEDTSPARDTQLAQYGQHEGDYEPALVVISIGGNDAGFATIGQMCLAPGDCAAQRDLWLAGLDEVEVELLRTFREVRDDFPGVPVVAIPYPSPIAANRSGEATPCDQVALMAPERRFITQFLDALNDRIRAAASATGVHYLAEMRDSLRDAGLQLCHPDNEGRPGLNFVGLRSVNGTADQRFNPVNWSHNSLHPNERGHEAMLRTFRDWQVAHPDLPAVAPEDPEAPSVEDASRPVEGTLDCSVYEKDESGCKELGTAWALRSVGDTASGWAFAGAAVAAIGAWAMAVGFFGWRRRDHRPGDQRAGRAAAAATGSSAASPAATRT